MHISAQFDSGNIEVISASDPNNIQLAIRKDSGADHFQWFHFRVSGADGVPLTLHIVNAHKASYPRAWKNYQARVSSDREQWTLAETNYDGQSLTIRHTPETGCVWFAYFAPYSAELGQDLIAEVQQIDGVSVRRLGGTLDGRDLDCIEAGTGPRQLWLIGRQHPGETMASFWMEGFLQRLLDPNDPLSASLLEKGRFHVVPNMNPDGAVRGNLRTNASGANLNREWHEPSLERSPEVYHVRGAMDVDGCDFCLDVHGDEDLPYNFISGSDGIPGWSPRLARLQKTFCDSFECANPDFQQAVGYPRARPGKANLTMATNQVAQRFDCLAMTLEQPFKDNKNRPNEETGWSPERCQALGRSAVDAIAAVMDTLR